jgi:hypothetical protein
LVAVVQNSMCTVVAWGYIKCEEEEEEAGEEAN